MSPEQAKGRAADKRSDIWALGCVLFEMLSGKQTFAGASTAEVLVSVLESGTRLDSAARRHAGEHTLSASTLPHEGSPGPPAPRRGRPPRVGRDAHWTGGRTGSRRSSAGACRGSLRVGLAAALLTGVAALATLAWHDGLGDVGAARRAVRH